MNGDFVHMGWDVGASQSPVRQAVDYWITPADSSVGISLGALPGDERAGAMPQPLGASPRVAIGANRAFIALSDSLSILTFSLDGKRGPTLRAPSERIRVTEADVRAALERDVRVVGEQARASVAAMHAASPRRTLLPATRDLLVDGKGLIWIQRYPEAGKPTVNRTVNRTVFRADGRVLATVPLPSDFDVFEVGRDYILGSAPDHETDMPLILLYALTR